MRRLINILVLLAVVIGFSSSVFATEDMKCDDSLTGIQLKYTSAVIGGSLLVGGLVTGALYADDRIIPALVTGAGTTVIVVSTSVLGPAFAADMCGKSPNYGGTATGALAGFTLTSLAARLILSEDGSQNNEFFPLITVGGYFATVGGGILGYNIQENMKHGSITMAVNENKPMVVWHGTF